MEQGTSFKGHDKDVGRCRVFDIFQVTRAKETATCGSRDNGISKEIRGNGTAAGQQIVSLGSDLTNGHLSSIGSRIFRHKKVRLSLRLHNLICGTQFHIQDGSILDVARQKDPFPIGRDGTSHAHRIVMNRSTTHDGSQLTHPLHVQGIHIELH
eukprot:scaffold29718_cov52-Attheya_sp.AAC.1